MSEGTRSPSEVAEKFRSEDMRETAHSIPPAEGQDLPTLAAVPEGVDPKDAVNEVAIDPPIQVRFGKNKAMGYVIGLERRFCPAGKRDGVKGAGETLYMVQAEGKPYDSPGTFYASDLRVITAPAVIVAPKPVYPRGLPLPESVASTIEELPTAEFIPTAVKTHELPAEEEIKASPNARDLAEKYGIDLATVVGKGRGGVITKTDMENAIKARTKDATPKSGA